MNGQMHLKITPCANGEAFEYRLFCENQQVGRSVFLNGDRAADKAIGRIMADLIESRHSG